MKNILNLNNTVFRIPVSDLTLVVALKPSLGAAPKQITPQKNMQNHCANMSFVYHLHAFCILDADLLRSVCMFFFANVCVFLAYVLYNMFFDFEYVFSHTFFGDNLDQYPGLGPALEHRGRARATCMKAMDLVTLYQMSTAVPPV